ncbi:MAG: conjugal transfer protein [Bacteroidetes bacterium]|nr:conjugal transfer protein [Bacteroidota bacterium]
MFSSSFRKLAGIGAAAAEMVATDIVTNIRETIERADGSRVRRSFGKLEDIAERHGEGFVIDGENALDLERINNLAVFGSTGVGKTSNCLIPTLLYSSNASYIVHDSSGTVFPLTAPRMAEMGVEIHRLSYSDILASSSINLLDYATSDEDANLLADHFVRTALDGEKADMFFNSSAVGLTSWAMRMCRRLEPRYKHMGCVRQIIQALSTKGMLDKLVAKAATPKLWDEYKYYRSTASDKTMSGIIMSALVALNPFSSDALCRASVKSSVDFSTFRDKRQILYIETGTYDSFFYNNLTSIVIESALRTLMKQVPDGGLPVYLLLDECSTLNLKSLSQCVSNSKKYNLKNCIFYQSPSQMIDAYGAQIGRNILLNCSHAYYGHQDISTSRDLAELCKSDFKGADGRKRSEHLMKPEEIAKMPKDRGLLFYRNQPFRLTLQPWFKNPILRMRTKGAAFVFSNPHIPETLDLIQFS